MKSEDVEVRDADDLIVPVVAEVPTVGKRTIETGRGVRVTKTVSERAVIVDEPSSSEEVKIERRAIGQEVAASDLPAIRQEGDTLIVPVLEEVPVLIKRIMLIEEIRITRSRREISNPQRLVLNVEQVSVEPLGDAGELPVSETTREGQPKAAS
jgi:stress response protein YsnF